MAKKLTEEIAIDRIKKTLKDINKDRSLNIVFIGFYGNKWSGNRTRLILKCNRHNIEWNTITYIYLTRKGTVGCPSCQSELNSNSKKKTTIEVIEEINLILDHSNKKFNRKIRFLGFQEGKYVGLNNTHLILYCEEHDCKWNVSFSYFISKSFSKNIKCKYCDENILNTPEKALKKVLELHKNDGRNYDYSNILTQFKDINSTITIICPIHGEFEIKYTALIRKPRKNSHKSLGGICPKCRLEKHIESRKHTDEEAVRIIHEFLEKRNKIFGNNIEFLGFVGGKYVNTKTKLILKCNKHNLIWDTVCFNTLACNSSIRGPLCPSCDQEIRSGISDHEKYCFKNVIDIIKENNYTLKAIQQYSLSLINPYTEKRKSLFLDIVIVDENDNIVSIIEYDGKQHYEFTSFFQPTYQNFVNQVNRDRCLEQYCKENNIRLLRISYKDNNRIPEIIKIFFEEGRDVTTKVEPKLLPVLYHG